MRDLDIGLDNLADWLTESAGSRDEYHNRIDGAVKAVECLAGVEAGRSLEGRLVQRWQGSGFDVHDDDDEI